MKQSWQQRERARELLSKEVGYVRKPHGGRLRVALAFPNTYFVGMSNLGLQTVYKLFNAEHDIVCERVFLPPKTELAAQLASGAPLVTIESQTPVAEFDVFAFSVSFEWDYTNVLTMLRLAGIPPRAEARTHRHPLIVIGGAVTFVNPEPLALFADAIAAGEGEVLVPSLLRAFNTASDRDDLLRRLAGERRAHDHDCARDRIGPAAARHQQDGHQRRDRRPRRHDLCRRSREPEALLHDRSPDGNRR